MKKIQTELSLDVEDNGGASAHARYLESLFLKRFNRTRAPCRDTGEALAIEMYHRDKLRKFFRLDKAGRANIQAEKWRYLDVLRTLQRQEFLEFTSSTILEEFGFSKLDGDEGPLEHQLPEGLYVLEPVAIGYGHATALLNVQQTERFALRAKFWISLDENLDEFALRDFVRFGRPPRSAFDQWFARGYEIGIDAPLETVPDLPPPYAAFILRHERNLTPGALIIRTGRNEERENIAQIRTPLFTARYKLRRAEEVTNG